VTALARQIGQLLWCAFEGLEIPTAFAARISAGEIGGVVLFRRNVGDLGQILEMNGALHAAAPAGAPLYLAIDQEGGRVQRVRAPATVWPPMGRLEAAGDVALAEAVGRALGAELAVLGYDIDFAPVLDVNTNPANPVIGDRAFGATAEAVIALAGGFARGLAAAGVLGCGKHFPGHGDTSLDSHLALPRIDHDLARLRAVELAPFRALGELPLIMTAHVVFAAIDATRPATLSPEVIGGVLRGELGYRGLVVSDDMLMGAIADHWGVPEAAEQALRAGCDVLLLCSRDDLQLATFAHLVAAAERDSSLRERVGESAARVLALKAAHPVRPPATLEQALAVVGAPAHQALARRLEAGSSKLEA
jgi:beta-N-acetylhexosaminidase